MKRTSTLLIALFVSLAGFAIPYATKLTISTINNQPLLLTVDGRTYPLRQNDKGYTINDIAPGYHAVKIFSQAASYGTKKNNTQLVYNGSVYMKNGYHTDITINRFGKAFVDEQQINAGGQYEEDGRWGNDQGYTQPMNSRSFEQLRLSIAAESFDNTRLNIARQTIADNFFSAAQAKQLVQLFSFDNSKLEIAKLLYGYTTDKNNYFTVYDAFSYSSSKDELSRYIQQYR
jgi:hypothetical protein